MDKNMIEIVLMICNLVVAIVALFAAQKAADAAASSAEIANEQKNAAVDSQKQSTAVMLLEHRCRTFNLLNEWVGYSSVLCNNNSFSILLERFYCFVDNKTLYVPIDVEIDFNNLHINEILVRLESEKQTIMLHEVLFRTLDVKEKSIISKFVNDFIEMILYIDLEMGNKNSIYTYANKLRKSTVLIKEAEILDKMRKEMNVLEFEKINIGIE